MPTLVGIHQPSTWTSSSADPYCHREFSKFNCNRKEHQRDQALLYCSKVESGKCVYPSRCLGFTDGQPEHCMNQRWSSTSLPATGILHTVGASRSYTCCSPCECCLCCQSATQEARGAQWETPMAMCLQENPLVQGHMECLIASQHHPRFPDSATRSL